MMGRGLRGAGCNSLSQTIKTQNKLGPKTAIAPSVTKLIDVTADVPSGYSMIGTVGFSTRHGSVLVQGCYATGTSTMRIECRNVAPIELEIEPRIIFLFARQ